MYKIKNKRNGENAYIIILFIVFLVLQFTLISLNRFKLEMYSGVLSAMQYGICLLMLRSKRKAGNIVSICSMLFSIVNVSIAAFRGSVNSIPGLVNSLLYLITLILVAKFNYDRELDNKTDMITGAYNRKGLYQELEDKVRKNKEFSIIYIYLENFKSINDGYGHAYGDALLCKIIKRINMHFGEEFTTARLGGAELVVIVDGNKNVKDIAERLLETITEKSILVVDDNTVSCYASCYAGISCFPKDAYDYESLIKHADIAMAAAMEEKSKDAYIFDSSMLDKMNRQNHIKNMIKESLNKKNFYLVYQPQFTAKEKKLRGFETLIRINNVEEGISPVEFIPVAEKNDLILQIDDYVLFNAMSEFSEIVKENTDLIISINVSAKDFASNWFVAKIKRILEETGFPANNLELEITEYCMVNSINMTTENIKQLKKMGIKIALDDFGTGYTSLNYVSTLPIDLLKIDKSLIDDIEKDVKRKDFVHAVIKMGQLMDCEVISEGVENESQLEYLKEFGCDFIQGFVWGKPLRLEEAKKIISK